MVTSLFSPTLYIYTYAYAHFNPLFCIFIPSRGLRGAVNHGLAILYLRLIRRRRRRLSRDVPEKKKKNYNTFSLASSSLPLPRSN